jgi:glutathione S-transferase
VDNRVIGSTHSMTPAQSVFGEVADSFDLIETLHGRERAVVLDLTRRRLRRLFRRHRPLLEEFALEPWREEPASIAVEWTRGRARIRTRGTDAELQALKSWLVGNDAAFADLAACVAVVKGER